MLEKREFMAIISVCPWLFFSTFDVKVQLFCFLLKQFIENVKKVYGRGVLERVGRVTVNATFFFRLSCGTTHLHGADGNTLLANKVAILKRWVEHFDCVLSRLSSINGNAINLLPQVGCNVPLDKFPTVTETTEAIQQLSSGKSPGSVAIPSMTVKLTELFNCVWRKEAIPLEFKYASIIHLYK